MTGTQMLWTGQAFAALYGLVLGSFWNVAIARLPEDRSLLPRSSCPRCGAAVRAIDNVPVLAWIWLRGRCRDCGSPIPVNYPLTELLGGLLGWLLFRARVPTLAQLDAPHVAAWVLHMVLITALVIGAYVDLRHRILPDQVTIYAVPVGVLGALGLEAIGYDGWLGVGWRQAVLGAAVWGGLFWSFAAVGRFAMRAEVLGYGDVKLAAMFGAFLGPLGAFLAVMWGSILGSVVGIVALLALRRRTALPFGPPLVVGALGVLFYGEGFVNLLFPQWRL